MEGYKFYRKYTDNIFIYRNTTTYYSNLVRVGEDKLLLEHDVFNIQGPINGFGIVHDYYEHYIDLNAENIFPWMSFTNVYPFTKYKKALVQTINSKYNFIDTTGNFLFNESFDDILFWVSNTYYLVRNNIQFVLDLRQGKLFQEVWKL